MGGFRWIVRCFVLAAVFYRRFHYTKAQIEEINTMFNISRFVAECLHSCTACFLNSKMKSWEYWPRSLVTLYVPFANSQKKTPLAERMAWPPLSTLAATNTPPVSAVSMKTSHVTVRFCLEKSSVPLPYKTHGDRAKTSAPIHSPLVISYDADGLVSISNPGDRPFCNNLSQGEDVRSRIGQVHKVFKHSSLVCKVWSLREGGVSCRRSHKDI